MKRRGFLAALVGVVFYPYGIPRPEKPWEFRRHKQRREHAVYAGLPKDGRDSRRRS